MGRFKAPAPAPPTPNTKLKTPARPRRTNELSLVAAFDDLMRNAAVLQDGAEKEFLMFVRNAQEWRKKWAYAETERQRLSALLIDKEKELTGKDYQIKQARKLVDEERRTRLRVEDERDNLNRQLTIIKDLVMTDAAGKMLNNETLERLRNLNDYSPAVGRPGAGRDHRHHDNMEALVEQSVESLLDASDLSFEESRDDGLDGTRTKAYNKRRSSAPKRRRSHSMAGDKIVTTTTVTVGHNGQAQAESMIEAYAGTVEELQEKVMRTRRSRAAAAAPASTPASGVKRTFSNASSVPVRAHSFVKKTVVMVEKCGPCGKRVKFGKSVYRCRECAAVCHLECKADVPLPCAPVGARTPTNKAGRYLADYTPVHAPMVPGLLVHCIKEVERRGIDEVGIYRVPGNEAEANDILDKFVGPKTAAAPKLARADIHAVASCVKKFLRSLKEPVIPLSLWQVFVDAATSPDTTDGEAAMYQAVSELPQPNRDTLAYLALHLQTVADNSAANKMDRDNLAMVMGPTVVGYSSPDPMAILSESDKQKAVMRSIMAVSADYWSRFLNANNDVALDNNAFGYANTPDHGPVFAPIVNNQSPVTVMTGGPARRTRSKQHGVAGVKRQNLFQSPMIY